VCYCGHFTSTKLQWHVRGCHTPLDTKACKAPLPASCCCSSASDWAHLWVLSLEVLPHPVRQQQPNVVAWCGTQHTGHTYTAKFQPQPISRQHRAVLPVAWCVQSGMRSKNQGSIHCISVQALHWNASRAPVRVHRPIKSDPTLLSDCASCMPP